MKRILAALGGISLLAAAPVAQAAEASRGSAPQTAESEIGGSLPLSVIIVLLTVLGGAIWLVVDDEDDPDSP